MDKEEKVIQNLKNLPKNNYKITKDTHKKLFLLSLE